MHDHAQYRIILTINILLIILYYAYGTQNLFMQVADICKIDNIFKKLFKQFIIKG